MDPTTTDNDGVENNASINIYVNNNGGGDERTENNCSRSGQQQATGRNNNMLYGHGHAVSVSMSTIQYSYSLALLLFCTIIVMSAIFTNQTKAGEDGIPPIVIFLVLCGLISWLAMMEGGQGCLVGLQPLDKTVYADSHPITHQCTTLAHKGDNTVRFIVGRQFLVVLVVFITNYLCGPSSTTTTAYTSASVLHLPAIANEVFLNSGLAMILFTIVLGQLTAQVNAAFCMLDFINTRFMLLTTYISLAVEMSGLLHSVYLVQMVFSKITRTPIEFNGEDPLSSSRRIAFWLRVFMSLGILAISLAVTLKALFNANTALIDGVPPFVSVILFFALMCFIGMMEGMQIALFAVVRMPDHKLRNHPEVQKNCELVFEGSNLQAFLIGRQICVTGCMFFIARITTLAINADGNDHIFGVPTMVQAFFDTGLLGAIITTIVGSLAWRVIGSSFPLAFLSNPLINIIIRLCLLLEKSGICSSSWVFARWHKVIAGYNADEVYLAGHERIVTSRRDQDIDTAISFLGNLMSLALLGLSIAVVMCAIFTSQTKSSVYSLPSFVACIVFWCLIIWLAMIEGGQGCLVGLQPLDKEKYASSHPMTFRCTSLAHKGDNMERFIVGRQFLAVLVVFVISMCASPVEGANVLGLPSLANNIFLGLGVALTLTTIVLGQLTAQLNAAQCMLDFINNRLMLFTTYISLAIEKSGLLHSAYLVQVLFAKLTGIPVETKEPPRDAFQSFLFWSRILFSLAVLAFSFTITLKALFDGKTAMWEGVPPFISVIIFFGLMCFVGLMEGMQIALFAVAKMPEEHLACHAVAHQNCKLTFEGSNLQAFLIGRQICVTCCMFVIARITSITINDADSNIFGVPDAIQEFFNTGLLGAVITTIVGSLAWRIIASSFPLGFLSNPLVNIIIRLCLLLEKSGICSSSWALAFIQKLLFKYRVDEEYIGSDNAVDVENVHATIHESIEVVVRDGSLNNVDRALTESSVIDESLSEDTWSMMSNMHTPVQRRMKSYEHHLP
mmetsp:Transcript_22812/g.34241  ORF Transcript_22812/g.34241 Transcript_22812/m.34241 type:complete len:1013 (-) Transcript_22812:83-3121(-)